MLQLSQLSDDLLLFTITDLEKITRIKLTKNEITLKSFIVYINAFCVRYYPHLTNT